MLKATIQIIANLAGVAVQSTYQRDAAGAIPGQSVALAAGNAGVLTTRTDDTDGELTMSSANHDIGTGDVIDVYWTDANGNPQVAYGATVGTVVGTGVPFTGASGTPLPAQDTAVVADEQVALDVDFDGDKVVALVCSSSQICSMVFEDAANGVLKAVLEKANEPFLYVKDAGLTGISGNPVDELKISNGSTSAAAFKMGGIYNSDQ